MVRPFALAAALALSAAIGFHVTASADISMTIPVIGQQDQAWGGAPLGTSPTDTVASSGCAVTAVTMMLDYYGISTDPGAFNAWLTANGGYFGDDDLLWAAVNQYTSNQVVFTGWYGPDLSLIKSELDVGHPVVAEVQLNGNQHFVLIVGYSGSSFQINDPWFADTVNFADRYGDPASGIVSIRTFMPGDPPGPRDAGRVNWIASALADLRPAQ